VRRRLVNGYLIFEIIWFILRAKQLKELLKILFLFMLCIKTIRNAMSSSPGIFLGVFLEKFKSRGAETPDDCLAGLLNLTMAPTIFSSVIAVFLACDID
jgi:hypothetical protein